MQALADANVLLALVDAEHLHHERVAVWFSARGNGSVLVCRSTQQSLLRLLTQEAVMRSAVGTLKRAWIIHDLMMEDTRFQLRAEPEGLTALWREYTDLPVVAPRTWADAYLAAFARAANAQLVTFDRGFRRYGGLSLILLDDPAMHETPAEYSLHAEPTQTPSPRPDP